MKAKINFGKINLYGTGRRYPVSLDIELRQEGGKPTFTRDGKPTGNITPEYVELSICGSAGSAIGGQCLDSLYPHLKNNKLFSELYGYWKKYHLNGMHAGTPEQETAINEWIASGHKYDYTAACEYLKSIGKYEVMFSGLSTGRRYENELYKYGHAWIIQELPGNVLNRIEYIIDTANAAKSSGL